jgi:Asp-tRNA(Asn)/Glu-tRNA(Gln) amidotransferase A subunit family amidase
VSEPWLQDACSLVDAFRARQISPVEAVQAVLDAVDADDELNAVCHVDAENALAAARTADVSLPWNPELTPGGSSGGTAAAVAV